VCLTGCERIYAEARFLAKTELAPSGCRVWKGALSRGGNRPWSSPYGSFRVNRQLVVRAHVFAAYLKGIISDLRVPCGMNLDHDCDHHGTMCCDCLQLIPATLNRQLTHSRPKPKTDVPYRTKTKKRPTRAKTASGNSKKSLPRAKKEVALSV
jgi:hypothetical protein